MKFRNLIKRPELNGREGRCEGWDDDRVLVKLPNNEVLRARPENLICTMNVSPQYMPTPRSMLRYIERNFSSRNGLLIDPVAKDITECALQPMTDLIQIFNFLGFGSSGRSGPGGMALDVPSFMRHYFTFTLLKENPMVLYFPHAARLMKRTHAPFVEKCGIGHLIVADDVCDRVTQPGFRLTAYDCVSRNRVGSAILLGPSDCEHPTIQNISFKMVNPDAEGGWAHIIKHTESFDTVESFMLDMQPQCNFCKQSFEDHSMKKCARCYSVRYCSEECQLSDWPSHKPNCKNFE